MKKKIMKRMLRGFPQGIALGYVISVCCSLIAGNGNYYACDPRLIQTLGNEITAVLVQLLCTGIIGSAFSAGTIVFEIDSWNIAKQNAVYFLVGSLAMMPIAYLMNWMEHSLIGVVGNFLVFTIIFLACWIANYLILRNRIKKMNQNVHQLNS